MLSDEARNRIFIATTDKKIGTEISHAIDQAGDKDAITNFHDVTGAGLFAGETYTPGQLPQIAVIGPLLGYVFKTTDESYRYFKVDSRYVGNARFHIHWTKSSNANEAGRRVRWRITYICGNGDGWDISGAPSVLEIEGVYQDSGTTTRIEYRTIDSGLIVGLAPSFYVSMKIQQIPPIGGPALSADPVLISADWTYDRLINR